MDTQNMSRDTKVSLDTKDKGFTKTGSRVDVDSFLYGK